MTDDHTVCSFSEYSATSCKFLQSTNNPYAIQNPACSATHCVIGLKHTMPSSSAMRTHTAHLRIY
jgi:hypothetical protein